MPVQELVLALGEGPVQALVSVQELALALKEALDSEETVGDMSLVRGVDHRDDVYEDPIDHFWSFLWTLSSDRQSD